MLRKVCFLVILMTIQSCSNTKKDCSCESDGYSIVVETKINSEVQGSSANRSVINFNGDNKSVVIAEYDTYGVNNLSFDCSSDTVKIFPKDLQTQGLLSRVEIISEVQGVFIEIIDIH